MLLRLGTCTAVIAVLAARSLQADAFVTRGSDEWLRINGKKKAEGGVGHSGLSLQRYQEKPHNIRSSSKMSLLENDGLPDGKREQQPCRPPKLMSREGLLGRSSMARLRSLFRRKGATASTVVSLSTLLTLAMPGRALALFGRSGAKPMESKARPVEQVLEEVADGVQKVAIELGEDIEEEVSDMMGDAEDESIPESLEYMADAVSDAVVGTEDKAISTAGELKTVLRNNPRATAVAVIGAAGAAFVITKPTGGRQRRRSSSRSRNSAANREKSRAPVSPTAGMGKSRVSPEVQAAKEQARAESLRNAKFDVDLDLFDDAEGKTYSAAPGETKPSTSSAEATKQAIAAKDAKSEEASLTEPAHPGTPVTSTSEGSSSQSRASAPAAAAATVSPTSRAIEEDNGKSRRTPNDGNVKNTKKRRPMMNLFRKDKGPQRSTTLEEAFSTETVEACEFREAIAAVLSRSAPRGEFDVVIPQVIEDATIEPVEGEGDQASVAAEQAISSALSCLANEAGFSDAEKADAVADVVNAMVVSLVDSALTKMDKKDDVNITTAVDTLLKYMDDAGSLFAKLCPGVELKPPIKYNGPAKRGRLEKLFEATARSALRGGNEAQMGKLDRLQDLFSIKEGKANGITQKIMMDLMMKLMSEGGGEDTEGLEKMMATMGGGDMSSMMGGMNGNKSPEDHRREVDALKAMVNSGEVPKEEVDALRKMYKDSGMDIDQLVNDPAMEASMDSDAKEVVGLLRKLLSSTPK